MELKEKNKTATQIANTLNKKGFFPPTVGKHYNKELTGKLISYLYLYFLFLYFICSYQFFIIVS